MALFIDTDVNMMSELTRYESSIVDIANTEGIDLAGKLQVAKAAIGSELDRFFINQSNYDQALMWQASQVPRLTIANVVTTDTLRQWHVYQTLAMTYRDAYHTQLNSRYEGQYAVYSKLATEAESTCLDTGVGIVWYPVRAADAPIVTTGGVALGGGGWFIRVAWTGGCEVEGAPGDMVQYSAPAGQILSVQAVNPPQYAMGWNLYAGPTETSLGLQNDRPFLLEYVWFLPPSGFRTGRPPGTGQRIDQLLRRRRILRRG